MNTLPRVDEERRPVVPLEGAPVVTMTSCNAETPNETYSFRTVPVWMKASGRKVKINAILDDASNETKKLLGYWDCKNLSRKIKFMYSMIQ